MAAFTDEQRSRVRYHMGLPDSEQIATIVNGERTVMGVVFAVDRTLALVNDTARPKILELVGAMDDAEHEIFKLAKQAKFTKLGKLEMNTGALAAIEAIYDAAGNRLANFLGLTYRRWRARGQGSEASGVGSLNGKWCR